MNNEHVWSTVEYKSNQLNVDQWSRYNVGNIYIYKWLTKIVYRKVSNVIKHQNGNFYC